ncbi:MAG: hypothetical protein ACJAUR_000535 [Ulvibacter sp.]
MTIKRDHPARRSVPISPKERRDHAVVTTILPLKEKPRKGKLKKELPFGFVNANIAEH